MNGAKNTRKSRGRGGYLGVDQNWREKQGLQQKKIHPFFREESRIWRVRENECFRRKKILKLEVKECTSSNPSGHFHKSS